MDTIHLDGSHGEGGGQILRSALTLSLLTRRPFRLANIRAKRSKPGLQPQHLACVRAAAAIGSATVHGDTLGSKFLDFTPGEIVPGDYRFDIGTAGATSLVLHTVYLPLALAAGDSRVTVIGGTHVSHSPCFHYLQTTWNPWMAACGLKLELTARRWGFYPRGGGEIMAAIPGRQTPRGLSAAECDFQGIAGFSAVASLPKDIAERQANRATEHLRRRGYSVDINLEVWPGGPGTVMALIVDTSLVPALHFALGERGKRAEAVADEAAASAIRHAESGAPVDEHAADQLLLPLAFADRPSVYRTSRLTSHLRTNIDTIAQFLDRPIHVDGKNDRPGAVRIH